MRSASGNEAFVNDKTEWISDKFFAQQRLAGNNPMSLKRVTIHGEGRNASKVTMLSCILYQCYKNRKNLNI